MSHSPRRATTHLWGSRLLLALGLTLFGIAEAQTTRIPGKTSAIEQTKACNEADKDRDKSLTAFEARHLMAAPENFAKLDKDGNGFLSMEEFTESPQQFKSTSKASAKRSSKATK